MTHFSLENFSFAFSESAPLFFDNVSISIGSSGLTCIVGKNGIGKSTFFRLLQGVVYPGEKISGKLIVGNQQYDLASAMDRQRLYQKSMVLHQSFDSMLAPHFTGFENLSFAQFSTLPDFSYAKILNQVGAGEQLFGLPLEKQVCFMSGGQRQILAMLMIVQKDLDLLLLDEPIAALDDANSDYVMQAIVNIIENRNLTAFCILHDHDVVARYARNLIEIAQIDSGKRILRVKYL